MWLRIMATLSIVLMLLCLKVEPMKAQEEGIIVKALELSSEFPHGIRFRTDIESANPITELSVHFNVIGRRASRYHRVDMVTGSALQADFMVRTDTLERYIPPESEISYVLEVRTQGGQRLVTAPRLFRYTDVRFDWQERRDGNLTILYYGSTSSKAQAVLDILRLTLKDMGPVLGVELERPVQVVMYSDAHHMLDAMPLLSKVLRNQLVTQGQAYAPEGIILLSADAVQLRGVASHELMHILMYEASHNPIYPIPAWLDEGVAEYGNKEPNEGYDIALGAALRGDYLMPMSHLAIKPGLSDEIILFYGQSRSFVGFLIETYGFAKLRQILSTIKTGVRTQIALQEVLGVGFNQLENQWRETLGVQAIEHLPLETDELSPKPFPTLMPFTFQSTTPTAEATFVEVNTSKITRPSRIGGFGCGQSPTQGESFDMSAILFMVGMAVLVVRRLR